MTDWLAERVAHVHAIEIDRRLEPALRATVGGRSNVELILADAMDVDLAALRPAPTAMVANLPYAVATPVVMTALPLVPRFCVMVQREVADRFFASPGTKAYGASSVLIQMACERRGLRKVSRNGVRARAQRRLGAGRVRAPRRVRLRPRLALDLAARARGVRATAERRSPTRFALAELPPPPTDVAGLRAEQLTPERFAALAQEMR